MTGTSPTGNEMTIKLFQPIIAQIGFTHVNSITGQFGSTSTKTFVSNSLKTKVETLLSEALKIIFKERLVFAKEESVLSSD